MFKHAVMRAEDRFIVDEGSAMDAGEDAHAEFLLDSMPQLISGYFGKKQRADSVVVKRQNVLTCKDCLTAFLVEMFEDGDWVCTDCGKCAQLLENTCRTRDYSTDLPTMAFKYKRSNHFRDWIAQVNGEEETTIPNNVLQTVEEYSKKNKIKPKTLTAQRVRRCLKEAKLGKYYENSQQICNFFNKEKKSKITFDESSKLLALFEMVQGPYDEIKERVAPGRRNFFSYPYIITKLCELLGFDHHLSKFTMLKSHGKIQEQDRMWSAVCKVLNWQFIPTPLS